MIATAESWLAFHWTPMIQAIGRDASVYTHVGPTDTSPSHDVAHLLLAAGSRLPWLPAGSDRQIRLAEFNAVLLEHLCCAAMKGEGTEKALAHARWFVLEHYKPFPVTFEEALEAWKNGIDVESVGSRPSSSTSAGTNSHDRTSRSGSTALDSSPPWHRMSPRRTRRPSRSLRARWRVFSSREGEPDRAVSAPP